MGRCPMWDVGCASGMWPVAMAVAANGVMGSAYSHEGATGVRLNGVLAKRGRRNNKQSTLIPPSSLIAHPPKNEKVRTCVAPCPRSRSRPHSPPLRLWAIWLWRVGFNESSTFPLSFIEGTWPVGFRDYR